MPAQLLEREIRLILRLVTDKLVLWPLGLVHRWYFLSSHMCRREMCSNKP